MIYSERANLVYTTKVLCPSYEKVSVKLDLLPFSGEFVITFSSLIC